MAFSRNLTEARCSASYNRQQMAEKLNVTLSTYTNYENGKREPSLATLKKIALILNVSADTLLGLNVC